jgi:hypothetical protein
MVRQLAEQANSTVLDHMKVLEETGLVDFGQIATNTTASPTNPSAQVAPTPSAGAPTVIVTTSPTFSLPPAASSPESQTK